MKYAALATAVAVASASHEAEWETFKSAYKTEGYATADEEASRFATFQANMVKADALTAERSSV